MSKAILVLDEDRSANGEVVMIQVYSAQKVMRVKFRAFPKVPGESEIGGNIDHMPTREEMDRFIEANK